MQQIYTRTPSQKSDFNKVAWFTNLLKFHFSCKFAGYFQDTSLQEHLWRADCGKISKFSGNNNGGLSFIWKLCNQLIQKDFSLIDCKLLYFLQYGKKLF